MVMANIYSKCGEYEKALDQIEVLLSQIENHVRLEQAAAESFLSLPATETLHARSASTLLN